MPAVRVPATSANLGPGFDAFALALGMYDQYNAQPADEWDVVVRGEAKGEIPPGEEGRVVKAMQATFAAAGEEGRAASVECLTRIPPGRGMGSSAAATVGGILLANAMVEGSLDRDDLLALAAEIEGHADNAAAAIMGGFVLTWWEGDVPKAVRLDPSVGLATILVVSDLVLETHDSRGLLPDGVPFADAVFNIGRASLLAAGLACGRPDLARKGLEDRIHQQYRAERVSDLDTVTRTLVAAGADGAVLSGAGPTVLGIVFDTDDSAAFRRAIATAEKAEKLLKGVHGRRPPVALPVDRRGASIV